MGGMAYADMMNATDCVGDYQAVRGNLSQMVAHCSANQANLAKCTQYWNVLQNASNGCMSDTAGPDCSKLTDPADVCGMAYMGMMSATDCVGDYQAVKGNLSQMVAHCSTMSEEEDIMYPEPSALPQGSPFVDVALEITMPLALAQLLVSNTDSSAAARQEFEEAFVTDMMAALSLPDGAQIEIISVSIRAGRRLQPLLADLQTKGSGLGTGLPHRHCLFVGIGASLGITKGAGDLAVLGQVEGGDLLPM